MLKLFDFVCQDCKQEFEKLLKDPKEVVCPHCNSINVNRKWTKSSFKVYGPGAYSNKMVV